MPPSPSPSSPRPPRPPLPPFILPTIGIPPEYIAATSPSPSSSPFPSSSPASSSPSAAAASSFLTVTQDVSVPEAYAPSLSPSALDALFPGASAVALTGATMRVPVQVAVAVQADTTLEATTAVFTTPTGARVEVEVGCGADFLVAFRAELAVRANISESVLADVSCSTGQGDGKGEGGARRRRRGVLEQGWVKEKEQEQERPRRRGVLQQQQQGQLPPQVVVVAGPPPPAVVESSTVFGSDGGGGGGGGGVCGSSGSSNSSVSLLVLLSLTPDQVPLAPSYREQLKAALDHWAAEADWGQGGGLGLCPPQEEDITTTAEVRGPGGGRGRRGRG